MNSACAGLGEESVLQNEKTPAEARVINEWCPDSESNQGHGDFQSPALPTELSGQRSALNRRRLFPSTKIIEKPFNCLLLRQSTRLCCTFAQIFQTLANQSVIHWLASCRCHWPRERHQARGNRNDKTRLWLRNPSSPRPQGQQMLR